MNYRMTKFVPVLLLACLLSASTWAQGRVATIDLDKVFKKYFKTQQADAIMKDRQAEAEKELKGMLDDRKKATEDYQNLLNDANNQALSAEERDKRKKSAEDKLKSIRDAEDTIRQYQASAQTRLQEQSQRMRANLLDEIRNTVTAKAKAGNYSMVIDTSAETVNRTPFVLYNNDDSNDLTQAVLDQLNAAAPDTAKADSTSTSKTDKKK